MITDRRALLASAGVGSFAPSALFGAPVKAVSSVQTVDVREYGAVGDGEADDTAAFNRACQAAAPWSESLCYAIYVPAGRYRLDGSVYVRKGQSLFGDGHATYIDARKAKASTFVLGRADTGGRGTPDPGGAPVRLSDFRSIGGAMSNGFVVTDAQGFSIANLFLTAVGIGIEVVGAENSVASDGIIDGIFLDQCLNGILIRNAQNILISNINIYRPRFAITIESKTHDILISSVICAYAEYVAVSIVGDAVRNVIFANLTAISNAQYESFLANILCRGSNIEVVFNGCTFRNWPRSAIVQDRAGDVDLAFSGCVFDANRSSDSYDWSKSSRVLALAKGGKFAFAHCKFQGIRGEIARMPAGFSQLTLNGGSVEECGRERLLIDAEFDGLISIRDVLGFAPQSASPTHAEMLLPVWHGGLWKVGVRLKGESGADSFAEEAIVHIQRGASNSGLRPSQVGGWKTNGARQTSFTIVETKSGPALRAAIATGNPDGARFSAETV